ncbi:hypothetical protein Scep_027458 [Stephania cephalantha]|uniref:U-box domain-containing protein n=1 Tax=Stephania cephalantha TaxID=152367 RepID=A0AAP0E868_9MAGN
MYDSGGDLFIAITGDSIVLKFEKARSALEESLRRVEDIVPQAIGCQVLVIVNELQRTIFTLDPLEKQVEQLSPKEDLSKKLVERARIEEDKRKESIVAYLLHLMRKYSKLFRSELCDVNDSQGSAPCSPTVLSSLEEGSGPGSNGQAFECQLSKVSSFNFRPSFRRSGQIPVPPDELRCPILLQLMYDPVIISSGQTYERACIEKWFSDGHGGYPKTH